MWYIMIEEVKHEFHTTFLQNIISYNSLEVKKNF